MSTQCLQTAGNNVKLFTCVFDSDDLGAELEAPPPVAFPRRCTVSVRRITPPQGGAPSRCAVGNRERALEGAGVSKGAGGGGGACAEEKFFFEGRFSAPKMRRPNKINGFAGSVPNGGGAWAKTQPQTSGAVALSRVTEFCYNVSINPPDSV